LGSDHFPFMEKRDPLTHEIIGAAIEVHREFGPVMLESTYEECLSYELTERKLVHQRQPALPVVYKGISMSVGYRPDLIVEGSVVVEIKTVEKLLKIHDVQVLTYLRLSRIHTGLLINFHAHPLIDGIRRLVL
jgi:GxxExxY protein